MGPEYEQEQYKVVTDPHTGQEPTRLRSADTPAGDTAGTTPPSTTPSAPPQIAVESTNTGPDASHAEPAATPRLSKVGRSAAIATSDTVEPISVSDSATRSDPPSDSPFDAGAGSRSSSSSGTGTPSGTARGRSHRRLGLLLLFVLLAAALLAGIAVGARTMSPATVYTAIEHAVTCAGGPFQCPAISTDEEIVRELRLPRTALAALTGAALAMAGALMQGYTRNPLADAGLLGLNAGAAFCAALSVYLFSFTAPDQYIWFAFAGTALAGLVVFGVSAIGGGKAGPLSLVLAGAAVTAFLTAMTNSIILLDSAALDTYRFWVVGTVAGRDTEVLWQVAPFLLAGMALALAAAPALNLLSLGDQVARGLGVNMVRTRLLGLTAVVLLCGAATAAIGPVGFLGLIVPHLARTITGPDHRWLLPYSALLGAVLLLTADVIGRVVARPGELQVGVVLAAIGAPFFIALVRRRRLVNL